MIKTNDTAYRRAGEGRGEMTTEIARLAAAVLCAGYMIYAVVWLFAPIPEPPAWPAYFAGALLGWHLDDMVRVLAKGAPNV